MLSLALFISNNQEVGRADNLLKILEGVAAITEQMQILRQFETGQPSRMQLRETTVNIGRENNPTSCSRENGK